MAMRFVSVALLLFSFLFLSGCLGEIKTPPKIETASVSPSASFQDSSFTYKTITITYLGQSGFLLQDGKNNIYIDPIYLPANAPKADYVLIPHDHPDHCDAQKIRSISYPYQIPDFEDILAENYTSPPQTEVITSEKCGLKLVNAGVVNAIFGIGNTTWIPTEIPTGGMVSLSGIPAYNEYSPKDFFSIRTVPAYNLNGNYHPKGEGLGFLLNFSGAIIYHAGDTDFIPEMRSPNLLSKCDSEANPEKGCSWSTGEEIQGVFSDIDVLMIPIGGKFTMGYKDAANATNYLKPKIVIPMHYNFEGGEKIDAEKDFAPLVNKNKRCSRSQSCS